MKHTAIVTTILILLFLITQITGLLIIKNYLPKETLPFNIEKPEIAEETSFIPLFITIIIATVVAFILIRFSAFKLWKLWFFISIFACLLIALAAFIPELIALPIAFIFTSFRIFKPNFIIHNLTEIFIYGGLAAIFVPVLSIFSITILLVLISFYDMIAVWKTKHMIKLAKFQTKSRMFAGLLVPYQIPHKIKTKETQKLEPGRTAILGGGDMGFPLLFAGVVLKTSNFLNSFIIVLTTTLVLFLLFYFAEKKKFYPAMPFLSLGCLLGYLITLTI